MKIAVVGGGLTGLVAGYRLGQKGHLVTIFEKNDGLGGLLGGFKMNGMSLERAYHHIFKKDKEIIRLIEELGLGHKLQWRPDRPAIYFENKMYPFGGALDLLRFSPLDFVGKLRLGLVKIWLEKDNNYQKYLPIPAYKWMRKWCGERAYQVIWEPLLRGKFHEHYKDVSMAWLWARIHTRGSGGLGYLQGGFQQIIDELEKRIRDNGGQIKLKTMAKTDELAKKYDRVLTTAPCPEVDYSGAVVMVFSSKQSLSNYYWHNINDVHSPILCFIQHTNMVNKRHYRGEDVYYMGTYGDENQNVDRWLDYVKKIFPKFDKNLVRQKQIFRFKYAQHIVDTKYQVPKYKLQKNVWQASFAQIFPEDRGINYAVKEGEKVALLMQEGRL